MAQDTVPNMESPRRRSGLLRDQVQLVKRKDSDRYEIVPIQDPLSFEKGFFVVIRACKLLAQKNEGIIIVGVAGPSGAGKTVFTEKLLNFMPSIAVITMDNYNDSSRIIDGNFDDPRLTDYDTLLENIHGLKEGKAVQVPIYDFKSSSRIGYRTIQVPSSCIVIIEGIYALSERLRPLLDLRVSVTGGVHFDLVKRVLRDTQRAGQEPEEIIHQISETVYPMYKAFIEPDLQTAHVKIINKFNPFSGFQNPTYILKSTRAVSVEQIKAVLLEEHKETTEEAYDIYLLPPGEDPEACQSYLRMRNRDGKYNLMFEEWVTDSPFIISPRITFEVSVRLLGGLMALGYTIAAILKRYSHIFSDDRVCVKIDWLEQLNRKYVQVQGRDRMYVKFISEQLGLDGSYIAHTYIEQIQREKLVNDVMALPDDLKTKLSIDDGLVSSPREALSRASADCRMKYLKRSMSHSYSTQRDKNLSKLTKLAVNTRTYDGRTPDSPATSVANQGIITQLSEQISTLNERMDDFTSRIEELNSKLSVRKVSASQQNLASQAEACNSYAPTSLFMAGLNNGSLTGSMIPNSASSSQLAKESPLMEEVSVAPGGRWSRFKTYSTIQRTLEIWGFVISFIFKAWLNNQKFSYRGGITEGKKVQRRKALAKWLKENILRLGPTFIKIGQQFSTRVDILAQEYVDQLSELQDQVPPFPSDTAISIVEEELGAPLNNIFERFDYEPIAAASLGQVHRAKLKGKEVVVKVQRPGLKDLFDIDLKNLRVIAEYLQKVDPKSDGAKRDWVAIYDECASVLYQEIDYTKEAANAELFAENFRNMDYVKVPTISWEYTTPQVLTMEYVPGIKINRIQALDQLGVDRQRLSRYAVESYLEQILSHGFFHADPHPGNIAVDDVNGGRLIFYDFGMMGSISPNIREGLLDVFYGVYEKDPDKVLQAMIQMGVLVPTGDMTAVRRTAQFFLNSFEERLAAQRREREMATAELGFKKPLSKEERIEKKKQRLAAIGEDLLAIAADQPFRFPATFTFVVRAFSVLDGIGKGLDARFDITEIAKPYALELLRFREAGVEVVLKDFRKRWDRQSRAFYNLFRQADRVERLAEIIQRLEQGDLKLRVRALESERAFQRVAAVQKTIGSAVAAGTLINLGTILYVHAIRVPSMVAYTVCAFFGFQVLFGIFKVKKLDQQERLITGTA